MSNTYEPLLKLCIEEKLINEKDCRVFEAILDGKSRVEEIAKLLNKDRSTIQRSLYRLEKAKLIGKAAKCCLPSGGRFFVYFPKNKKEVAKHLKELIDFKYRKKIKILERWLDGV